MSDCFTLWAWHSLLHTHCLEIFYASILSGKSTMELMEQHVIKVCWDFESNEWLTDFSTFITTQSYLLPQMRINTTKRRNVVTIIKKPGSVGINIYTLWLTDLDSLPEKFWLVTLNIYTLWPTDLFFTQIRHQTMRRPRLSLYWWSGRNAGCAVWWCDRATDWSYKCLYLL